MCGEGEGGGKERGLDDGCRVERPSLSLSPLRGLVIWLQVQSPFLDGGGPAAKRAISVP